MIEKEKNEQPPSPTPSDSGSLSEAGSSKMSEPAIRSVEDIQHPPSPKLNGNTIVSQADDMEYDDEYESEISGSQQINGSQMH